ncbi:MAG: hypothetical protein M1834_005208 [Cirrosporium novae-zelandiae]|nr:MAG: hypothetical protein M1834_005208 [Cirrosporium novae-zelandiae]
MSVEAAINTYIELSSTIFTPRRRTLLGGRFLHNMAGRATFEGNVLKECIKKVVREQEGNENAPLYQQDPKSRFVCASMSNAGTQRLRSYTSIVEERMKCTIWEAARATSAAPTFFEPITFTNGLEFRDGGLGDNNPIFALIDEANTEYHPRKIHTIVSLGTGVTASIKLKNSLTSLAKACAKIATDTEKVANNFTNQYCREDGQFRQEYFRFNVPQGLQGVGLEEWKKRDAMSSNTLSYLQGTQPKEQMIICAQRLRANKNLPAKRHLRQSSDQERRYVNQEEPSRKFDGIKHQHISQTMKFDEFSQAKIYGDQLSHVEKLEVSRPLLNEKPAVSPLSIRTKTVYHNEGESQSFYQLDRIRKRPVEYFVEREELLQLKTHFQSTPSMSPNATAVVLVGLGGSGKTQLMLQYASTQRKIYDVVLWFDAQDKDKLLESFNLAAAHLGLVLPYHRACNSVSGSTLIKHQSQDIWTNAYAIKRELQRRKQPHLLLFDGADTITMIECLIRYIPSIPGGNVLISSRRQNSYRLATHSIEISGLPTRSARDLLLYHARIFNAGAIQQGQADKIIESLDCIALAIDLAGTYIHTLGSLDTYLRLYGSKKDELLMRAIGSQCPIAMDYKISVFNTWAISIQSLSTDAQRFLYFLCLLDLTNLRKDLFERACSVKQYWDSNGNKSDLYPRMNGVPEWLLQTFCDTREQWSDFKFHEIVKEISSLFFLQKEEHSGTWLHTSGVFGSQNIVPAGDTVTLLRLPQPLYNLGKYYLDANDRQALSFDAFHSIQHALQTIDWNSSNVHASVIFVSGGAAVIDRNLIECQLEETFRHILAFKDYIRTDRTTDPVCFAQHDLPIAQRCEAIIFANSFMQPVTYSHSGRELEPGYDNKVLWKKTMRLADALLCNQNMYGNKNIERTSGHWDALGTFYDKNQEAIQVFEGPLFNDIDSWALQNRKGFCALNPEEWARRYNMYFKKIPNTSDISHDICTRIATFYCVALVELMQLEATPSLDIMREVEKAVVDNTLDKNMDCIQGFDIWKKSDIGRKFIHELKRLDAGL